jgi:folate-dependent phosphoribosylglycinamide formyltransferase PurN
MAEENFRIAIITSGNYFARMIIEPVLDKYRQRICSVVIITGDYQGRVGFKAAWSLVRSMALPYFVYKVFVMAMIALLSRSKGGGRFAGLDALLRTSSIEHGFYRRANDDDLRAALTEAAPDILVCVSCPQKISKETLRLAKRAAINIHSSLLPRYAGLAPYFWVLSRGEQETGTTVHYMTEEFDAGNILSRRVLSLEPGMSAFDLFERLAHAGGEALAEGIEAAARGDRGSEQGLADRSYYSHPTLRSYIELRGRGHRLIRASDVRRLVGSRASHRARGMAKLRHL